MIEAKDGKLYRGRPHNLTSLSRIKRKHIRVLDNGCWEWKSSCSTSGRGQVTYKKKNWMAHSLVYFLTHGRVLRHYELHHVCENIKCVNPDHLTPLTRLEHERRHHDRG